MAAEKGTPHLDELAEVLSKTMKSTIENNSNVVITGNPDVAQKNISEYEGKMRVSGMDIFNSPTYISLTSFYPSEKDRDTHNSCGAIMVYLKEEGCELFLRAFGYKEPNEDEDDTMKDGCGKFFEMFLKNFIKDLASAGYGQLVNSEIENHKNVVSFMIDFDKKQFEKLELIFSVKEVKTIAVELTMRPKAR